MPFLLRPKLLLPLKCEMFYYHGSLTTPPCSETVQFMIMRQPLHLTPNMVSAACLHLQPKHLTPNMVSAACRHLQPKHLTPNMVSAACRHLQPKHLTPNMVSAACRHLQPKHLTPNMVSAACRHLQPKHLTPNMVSAACRHLQPKLTARPISRALALLQFQILPASLSSLPIIILTQPVSK